jgi:NAD+ kinase
MPKFNLITKGDRQSEGVAATLREALLQRGMTIDPENPDIVITVGGDGTFLRAIHRHLDDLDRCVFIGMHTGTLGFTTNYATDEWDLLVYDLTNHTAPIVTIPLLKVEVETENGIITYHAVNEIRVENIIRTQLLNVTINQTFLETFRGTGLCISGQVGSTAYNRSAGGAILQEGLDLLQITEITGIHHRAYRSLGSPLVIAKDSVITLGSDDFHGALLCYDHESVPLDHVRKITIRYAKQKAQVMTRADKHYFDRLKNLF